MLACLKTAEVTAAAFKGSHTSWENIGSSFRAKNYILQQTGLQFSSQNREEAGKKNKNKSEPSKQGEIKSGINNNTSTFCSLLMFATKQQRVPTSQDARHR